MAKTQIFEIKKDFGSKTLEKVFVKKQEQQEVSLALRDKIESALARAKTVCVVAESAFSGTLMDLLLTARNERGLRIYVIVKSLSGAAFERLTNNCIVREVPEISGNYLLCDTSAAFFFDADLSGYALHNEETVRKLHDIFIYEFWNNASKEYVAETKPVAERTFDVAPVEGSERVIIDRSALEAKPYQMRLDSADSFVAQNTVSEQLKNAALNGATIYLDKQGCMAAKDWLLKTDGLYVVCTDTSHIPLCKSNGKWYALNSNFDKSADNTGKLFAVQLEETPIFANTHTLKDSFTYREAVGKTMFRAKDFSPVAIDEIDREERSVSYDYKRFKKIAKMPETEREAFFNKLHLLESDKLAVDVSFSVTMTVKKLSKGAVLAPIYAEYEQFAKKQADAMNKIRADIDASKNAVKNYADELQKIEANITDFENRRAENEQTVKNQGETENRLQSLSKELAEAKKAKSELEKFEGEQKKRQKQIQSVEEEIGKLQKKKKNDSDAQKNLSVLKAEIEVTAKKIETLRSVADNCSRLENEKAVYEKAKKENQKKIDDFKKHSQDGEKFETQKKEKSRQIEAEKHHLSEREALLSKGEKLSLDVETVSECKEIASVLAEFKLPVPAFDKPKYGTLYKVKATYEYELTSDEDSDEAEVEMSKAGISDVEFVSASK